MLTNSTIKFWVHSHYYITIYYSFLFIFLCLIFFGNKLISKILRHFGTRVYLCGCVALWLCVWLRFKLSLGIPKEFQWLQSWNQEKKLWTGKMTHSHKTVMKFEKTQSGIILTILPRPPSLNPIPTSHGSESEPPMCHRIGFLSPNATLHRYHFQWWAAQTCFCHRVCSEMKLNEIYDYNSFNDLTNELIESTWFNENSLP